MRNLVDQANPEADKKFKERMFSGPEQRVQPTISRATSSEICTSRQF